MSNPFYNGNNVNRNQNKPTVGTNQNNLSEIYKMLTSSNNPMALFNNIAKNNPNMAPVTNLLNKGMSPEQVFNMLCQQRGINPQDFIKSIKG